MIRNIGHALSRHGRTTTKLKPTNKMKTSMTKAMMLTIGLLSAGAISSAQTNADSYVMPKTAAPNFYLEAGPSYMSGKMTLKYSAIANASIDGPKSFIGGDVAFGWRFAPRQKVQLEVGFYGSNSVTVNEYVGADVGYVSDVKATATPILASYSYCLPLGSDGRSELRLTPMLGFMAVKLNLTRPYDGDGSGSNTAFAAGAGVGYTYHFSSKFYLDAGVRYLNVGKASIGITDSSNTIDISAMNTFAVSASFGWKF